MNWVNLNVDSLFDDQVLDSEKNNIFDTITTEVFNDISSGYFIFRIFLDGTIKRYFHESMFNLFKIDKIKINEEFIPHDALLEKLVNDIGYEVFKENANRILLGEIETFEHIFTIIYDGKINKLNSSSKCLFRGADYIDCLVTFLEIKSYKLDLLLQEEKKSLFEIKMNEKRLQEVLKMTETYVATFPKDDIYIRYFDEEFRKHFNIKTEDCEIISDDLYKLDLRNYNSSLFFNESAHENHFDELKNLIASDSSIEIDDLFTLSTTGGRLDFYRRLSYLQEDGNVMIILQKLTDKISAEFKTADYIKMIDAAAISSKVGMYLTDAAKNPGKVFCTDYAAHLFNFDLREDQLYPFEDIHENIAENNGIERLNEIKDIYNRGYSGEYNEYSIKFKLKTSDGDVIWVRDKSSQLTTGEDGTAILVTGTITDITADVELEEQINLTNQRLSKTLELTKSNSFVFSSKHNGLAYIREDALKMFGFFEDDVINLGSGLYSINMLEVGSKYFPTSQINHAMKRVTEAMEDYEGHSTYTLKHFIYGDRNDVKFIAGNISKQIDGNILVTFVDVTESYILAEKSRVSAITDDLTGLKNRTAFKAEFEGEDFSGLMIVDIKLNDLTFINDTYGHDVGDYLLVEISNRIEKFLVDSSTYRLTEDEFILIIDPETAIHLNTLLLVINEPIHVNDISFTLNTSIGTLNLDDFPQQNFNTMISFVSYASRMSKREGKNRIFEVNEEIITKFERRNKIYKHISKGLNSKHVIAVFQPYICAKTNKVIGFEALARMVINDVVYYPDEFLPLIEEDDNIKKLDLIILEKSIKFGQNLQKLGLISDDFIISSNLSTKSIKYLKYKDFKEIFDKYDSYNMNVELEVTEQILLDSKGYNLINDLYDRGFQVAIDDFSAGYASLKYLASLKATTLKLDKELCSDLYAGDRKRNIIYRSILNLAKELDLHVVSEGVESKEQSDILSNLGTDILQGYWFSKPIHEDEFIEFLTINNNSNNNEKN